ncbi:PRC-barrel domain-containing protein [Chamaesiphon sp.]|uniref:PRC-barrel domain-containing protein n=1 Tax=Chamaesiphon sp. TaxID=2814140 RepID=UPI003594010C
MTSELIRQRSDLIDTQVIAKDTGKRLGIVKELLVDIDSREVVAMGLRDGWLAAPGGLVKYMFLATVEKMGDVILVPNDDAIADLDPENYTNLIGCEVITETGDMLGKVRGFKFNCDDGQLTSIIIAAIGLPLIPDNVISTYEFSIDEVVSSGPNRLMVFEGCEERLDQLSVGFLERIGLGKAPWEDEYSYRPAVIRPENQLAAGTPIAPPAPVIRAAPPVQQPVWAEDDNWQEVQAAPLPQRLKAEPLYYDDDEGENWNDTSREQPVRATKVYQDVPYTLSSPVEQPLAEDILTLDDDIWGDDTQSPAYQPQKINIPPTPQKVDLPQKVEQVEYQEEEQH